MDSDQGKLFIGGISWETDEGKLKDYFQGYGQILHTVVMRDKTSGNPRGFGFVVFADPNILDSVLQDIHVIDGRTVEAKRALSRDEQQVSKVGNPGGARNFGGGGEARTKKIFVGGLPPILDEDDFRQYFEAYGTVTDVVIMYDQQTNRPRGFGFISFDLEDAVDRVLHKTFHDLNGKQVEVKRATPKDGGGGRSMGGGSGGGGGGYQVYGSSIDNSSSYDGRMESNRYTQTQNPSYGSSGYSVPGYRYGPTNNGMGYGYGNYCVPTCGGYGNPNAAGPQNAQRSSWGSQVASGYGYGASQWSGAIGGGGPCSGGAGQSLHSASGYGNQGYGYSGHDGASGNQCSYGAVSGRAGSGGGYGDGNGNSGYGNPDSVSYGGGYGGAST